MTAMSDFGSFPAKEETEPVWIDPPSRAEHLRNLIRYWLRNAPPNWLYRRARRRWYCVYCHHQHHVRDGCPVGLPLNRYGPRFMVYGKRPTVDE